MAHEIDFLAVGDGAKSGDAIALRYGNLAGPRNQQIVAVIDGGTKESGENLVNHIKGFYGTTYVDYVFSTHPDLDHASGLRTVLEALDFGTLYMHQPWNHASAIRELFKSDSLSAAALSGKLKKALESAHDLKEIAEKKQKPIVEPFQGLTTPDGNILVLGPEKGFYQSLLPQFRDTPVAKEPSIISKVTTFASDAITLVAEALHIETLDDAGSTSPENNSSAILLLKFDGKKFLFTADAGIPALTQAADYANLLGIPLNDLSLLQVPHHGSKRNVGPTILTRLKTQTAFISAGPQAGPKHPAKKVTNALIRRGANVHATRGLSILNSSNGRLGWESAAPREPFYDQVEM